MEITQELMDAVESTAFSEDQKQDFYVWVLEQDEGTLDLTQTPGRLKATVNKYMWNRAQNQKWVDDNRKRLIEDNEQLIRDIYCQHEEYAEDPSYIMEAEEELEGFLYGLSDTNRRTFERLYLDGLTPQELADEEGVDRNTINQRVHNIKQQLIGETQ